MTTKSRFAGLSKVAGRKPVVEPETAPRGRPKSTSADSLPATFHVSEESIRQARIKLLQDNDKRPLSRIVELLLDEWNAGNVKLPLG